jgi:hypothetical protein
VMSVGGSCALARGCPDSEQHRTKEMRNCDRDQHSRHRWLRSRAP